MAANLTVLQKVFSDEEFAKEVAALSDTVEIKTVLKAKGVEFTIEEIKEIGDLVMKLIEEHPDGELSMDQLDDVAGGYVPGSMTAAVVVFCAVCVLAAFCW